MFSSGHEAPAIDADAQGRAEARSAHGTGDLCDTYSTVYHSIRNPLVRWRAFKECMHKHVGNHKRPRWYYGSRSLIMGICIGMVRVRSSLSLLDR